MTKPNKALKSRSIGIDYESVFFFHCKLNMSNGGSREFQHWKALAALRRDGIAERTRIKAIGKNQNVKATFLYCFTSSTLPLYNVREINHSKDVHLQSCK